MTKEQEYRITMNVKKMVEEILTDAEIMNETVIEKIKKALAISHHCTSTYALADVKAEDVHGKDSKTSGWYITMEGTRASYRFFLNNDMEIVRKPRNTETKATYKFRIEESFWTENF